MATTETRTQEGRFECRASSSGQRIISGIGVPYSSTSEDLGGFFEEIAPGAFHESLASEASDIATLFNHDPGRLLGRESSGTMTVTDSPTALRFSITLPDTSDGNTCWTLAQRGDLKSASIGFYVRQDNWKDAGLHQGKPLRVITSADLREISLVTFPAYANATVSAEAMRAVRALTSGLNHMLGTFGATARRRRLRMLELG
jgi:HK97 family phage prohead protease